MTYETYWKHIERPKRIIHSFLFRKTSTQKILKKFFRKHKNELMLDYGFGRVVRLVGLVDGKDDYYYVYQTTDSCKGNLSLDSCVGQPIILKGRLSVWDYLTLEHQFNLNGLTIQYGRELMSLVKYKSL